MCPMCSLKLCVCLWWARLSHPTSCTHPVPSRSTLPHVRLPAQVPSRTSSSAPNHAKCFSRYVAFSCTICRIWDGTEWHGEHACGIYFDWVSCAFVHFGSFWLTTIAIECQDSRILMPLECLVLVATGSWVPLPTSHPGLSDFLSSFLDMSSSTHYTVVGASVSEPFHANKWRTHLCLPSGRPLIMPIYLSSLAFNFISMTLYRRFCFLPAYLQPSLPHVNLSTDLPSAKAHCVTCYVYAQNLLTVVTILLFVGLALMLLISFFSPEHLPSGLTPPVFDQSISSCDRTFFDQSTGTLPGYAKDVLIANAM